MKLFHWKAARIDLLVMSETEEGARAQCLEQAEALAQWDPPRADELKKAIRGNPYYVAGEDHAIAIDAKEKSDAD